MADIAVRYEEGYWYPDDGAIVWLAGYVLIDPDTGRFLARDAPELAARGLIVTGIAGAARFHDAALQSADVDPGASLGLRREPANDHDPNAIAVLAGSGDQLGWVPREVAAGLAGELDAGRPWSAVVLRERRASPREPRTGLTMLLAPAATIELREDPPGLLRSASGARACVAMARDTGFPTQDAQDDFLRARRRRMFAQLSALLRLEAGDVDVMLSLDEVLDALGMVGERDLGVRSIRLELIVGTVDRRADFDRAFRPTSATARTRFERVAEASRRGVSLPPIDVYRVGELYFVRDGHHRVAVARAQGRDTIDAHVVEVLTRVAADTTITLADLPLKSHERVFHERVPLPPEARARIQPLRPDAVRNARGGRRGVGLSSRSAGAAPFRSRRDRAALVRGGVPPGPRDPARCRPDRPARERYGRLHADVQRALPHHAHPRVERRGDRARAPRPLSQTDQW